MTGGGLRPDCREILVAAAGLSMTRRQRFGNRSMTEISRALRKEPLPVTAGGHARYMVEKQIAMLPQATMAKTSAALAAQHELIPFGVLAHCEVGRLTIFPLGFRLAATASGDDLGSTRDDVGHLHGDPRPGAFALTAAMNRDETTGDGDFGNVRVLPNDVATKTTGVKCRRPLCIGSPDGVFEFLDDHFAGFLDR